MKTFILKIDEKDKESGVKLMSLVENPAMESDFIAYNENQKTFFASDEKRFLTGAILIPNKPILRVDGAGNPYKVILSAKDIEAIAKKFYKEGNQNNSNEEHSIALSNNTLFESWIKISENDKSKDFGLDHLPVGTWFGTMYISDEKYWNEKIKTGKVRGFSIEGFFKQLELDNKLLNEVKNKSNMSKKNIFSKFKDLLKQAFQEQFLEDGKAIEITDEDIVHFINEDGTLGETLPAGDYKLQDGSTITVDETGKIVKEAEPTESEKEEPKAEEAPKEKLESAKFLTGESIDITDEAVTIDGQPAPDGVKFIVANDGQLSIAKIKEGKIESTIEILDAEKALGDMQMEAVDPDDTEEQTFASYKDVLEKQKKRNAALKAKLKEAEEKVKSLEALPAAEKIVTNEFSKVASTDDESNPVMNYMKLMGKI